MIMAIQWLTDLLLFPAFSICQNIPFLLQTSAHMIFLKSLSFSFGRFIFLLNSVCACVLVCAHMWVQVPTESRQGFGATAVFTGGCGLPCVGVGSQIQVWWKSSKCSYLSYLSHFIVSTLYSKTQCSLLCNLFSCPFCYTKNLGEETP